MRISLMSRKFAPFSLPPQKRPILVFIRMKIMEMKIIKSDKNVFLLNTQSYRPILAPSKIGNFAWSLYLCKWAYFYSCQLQTSYQCIQNIVAIVIHGGHTHIMLWGRGHKGGNHKNIWKFRQEKYLPLKVISFIFHIFLLLNYWIMSFILKYLTTHGYYYRYVLKIIVIFTFYLFSPLLIKWGLAGCSFFVLFTAFLGIFQPCSFFMSQKSLYTLFMPSACIRKKHFYLHFIFSLTHFT